MAVCAGDWVGADGVVETESAGGGPLQERMIEQPAEGGLCHGEGDAVERGRGVRGDVAARTQAEPAEETLLATGEPEERHLECRRGRSASGAAMHGASR